MQSVDHGSRDPIVMAVLNQIFENHQIDSECVQPDYKLGSDLGLTRIQIQVVLKGATERLGLQIPFESCRVEDVTARDLVDLLRHWSMRTGERAA